MGFFLPSFPPPVILHFLPLLNINNIYQNDESTIKVQTDYYACGNKAVISYLAKNEGIGEDFAEKMRE